MSKIITKLNILGKTVTLGLLISAVSYQPAQAASRYSTPPATKLSADLASPWLLQLGKRPIARKIAPSQAAPASIVPKRATKKRKTIRASVVAAPRIAPVKKKKRGLAERFLPQMVTYKTNQKPGTVVISTNSKYLYLVMGNNKARRYGVGVGRKGFTWSGVKKITRKAEWPGWTPPKEMIERQRKKGNILPAHMPGGPNNPLGARALYLGSSLYRIHGTTQPWTIGTNVSSGCIRMRNEDVIDFYSRVKVGTKVIVH